LEAQGTQLLILQGYIIKSEVEMEENFLTLRDLARLLEAAQLAPKEFLRRVHERDAALAQKLEHARRHVRVSLDEIYFIREILSLSRETVEKLNAQEPFEFPDIARYLAPQTFKIPLPPEIGSIVRKVVEDSKLGIPQDRNFLKTWGAVITSHRRALGLTRAQLAYHSKLSKPAISRIERGSLSVSTLSDTSKALAFDHKLERLVRTLLKIAKNQGNSLPYLQRLYDVNWGRATPRRS
jgi:transcriptional regulator with XRE-family HTH domain